MRRIASGAVLSVVAVPALVALPVLSKPAPKPHPVAGGLQTVRLGGFDRPAPGVRESAVRAAPSTPSPGRPGGAGSGGRADERVASSRVVARTLATRQDRTRRFAAVGVTWTVDPRLGEVTVAARGRRADGTWTSWQSEEREDEGTPNAGERVGGSGMIWLGDSTGVDVKVTTATGASPRNVAVQLIDPGTSAADSDPAGTVPHDSASAAAGKPAIYTRAQWGADERLMTWTPEYAPRIKAGFVHHTVQSNSYTAAQVPAMIRADYRYHAVTRGWGDIGYNFLVDRFGRTWQGRAGDMSRPVVGAHTGGFNYNTFGIAMIGDFTKVRVPSAVVVALGRVFAWKFTGSYVDPYGYTQLTSSGGGTSRYPAGVTVTKPTIMGHRDVGSTTCPGGYGYAIIPGLRTLVRAYMAPLIANPSTSNASPRYAGPTVNITAVVRGARAWQMTVTDLCSGVLYRRWAGAYPAPRDFQFFDGWNLRDGSGRWLRAGRYRLTLSASNGAVQARSWIWDFILSGGPGASTPPSAHLQTARSASGFVPVAPTRLLDTRLAGARVGAGGLATVQVTGVAGVPSSGVTAVAVSIAGRCPTMATSLSAYAYGGLAPNTELVQVPAYGVASGVGSVPVSPDGKITVRNANGETDLNVDVVGYYTSTGGARYHPAWPTLLYDSRTAAPKTPFARYAGRNITVRGIAGVPASATAVALATTVVGPTGSGSLIIEPTGLGTPTGRSLEFTAGDLLLGRVFTAIGADGAINVRNYSPGTVHVRLDVVGWYAPASVAGGLRFVPLDPARSFDTRTGLGVRAGKVASGTTLTVTVRGRTGIPTNADLVAMTVGAPLADATSAVVVWGNGDPRPAVPGLFKRVGRTMATYGFTAVGNDAVALLPTYGGTQLYGDVDGYWLP